MAKPGRLTWIDNYGAGEKASPLEVHTYWHEIIKQQTRGEKHHTHIKKKNYKDQYNSYAPSNGESDNYLLQFQNRSKNIGKKGVDSKFVRADAGNIFCA